MEIIVLWDLMPYRLINDPEDGGSGFFRNVVNELQDYTVSHLYGILV
jgi:hypothetical protein